MPTSKELIKLIEDDGWYLTKIEGSHHHFKHPTKPGKVKRYLTPGTTFTPKHTRAH